MSQPHWKISKSSMGWYADLKKDGIIYFTSNEYCSSLEELESWLDMITDAESVPVEYPRGVVPSPEIKVIKA